MGSIRDPYIRGLVCAYLESRSGDTIQKLDAKKLTEYLHDFGHKEWLKISGQARPMRSIRVLISSQNVLPGQIPSAPYKGYAPNYVCCDIYRMPKGKKGKWKKGEYTYEGVFWSYVDLKTVKNKDDKKPHPAAKFVMRLFKKDMLEVKENGKTKIMRVYGFSTTNNCIDIRPQWAANPPRKYVAINALGASMRKIIVSPDGKMM